MSEYLNNAEKRRNDLMAFSMGMMNGDDGKVLIEKYKEAIENVTPQDMLKIEDKQMQMGITPDQIKGDIEKIINVFVQSLNRYPWEKPAEGSFLFYLMLENDAYTFKLNQVKRIIKNYKGREESEFKKLKSDLLPHFKKFQEFDFHYIKKENILFPYLEACWESYRPLKVMWSLHDDIRKSLKELIAMLESDISEWQKFNKQLGKYFSLVFRMIQKENSIIFPVATETVKAETWHQMHIQSFGYPFPFIEVPEKPKDAVAENLNNENRISKMGKIISSTGNLSAEQVLLAFNHLPVDITLVDSNDKVVFFNKAKNRFFPRSPAIIGRAVQNCHPPESVHIVENIIEAFRSGKKNKADFWIQMKGKFILIQYFALHDENGNYKGVIEVSQDVSAIRDLKGEKRLLNWV
ncbi:MAG: PAS domain-containing protein [Bacteroidales bacterium]|nr:PAS domain-containing protein [Bacteroidales bacterium]MDD3961875.1 PAS domain-containing protein [Bacteroidales bacterium]